MSEDRPLDKDVGEEEVSKDQESSREEAQDLLSQAKQRTTVVWQIWAEQILTYHLLNLLLKKSWSVGSWWSCDAALQSAVAAMFALGQNVYSCPGPVKGI